MAKKSVSEHGDETKKFGNVLYRIGKIIRKQIQLHMKPALI